MLSETISAPYRSAKSPRRNERIPLSPLNPSSRPRTALLLGALEASSCSTGRLSIAPAHQSRKLSNSLMRPINRSVHSFSPVYRWGLPLLQRDDRGHDELELPLVERQAGSLSIQPLSRMLNI